jgi:hypothetical protein
MGIQAHKKTLPLLTGNLDGLNHSKLPIQNWEFVEARSSIRAALRFLLGKQRSDGSWRDFNVLFGESSSWVTACVLISLSDTPSYVPRADLAGVKAKALQFLRSSCKPTGGWGYNENPIVPDDCDSTAHAILAFRMNDQMVPNRNIRRLEEFEIEPGHFVTFLNRKEGHSWGLTHSEVGAIATIALGGSSRVRGLAEKLEYDLDRFGSWPSFWWRKPLYSTYACSWFLSHFGICCRSLSDRSEQLADTLSSRSPLEAAFSGLAAYQLGHHQFVKKAFRYLIRNQKSDGSWESSRLLRNTDSDQTSNWLNTGKVRGKLYHDQNKVFTTSTITRFLMTVITEVQPCDYSMSAFEAHNVL